MAVGVKDVAVAAGVSVGTVSNVLNRPERVSAETASRVQQAIRDLGFVRNDAARQLRAGHSRSIGMVVPDIGNPFFADVARGAEARAAEAGLAVLFGSSDERADRDRPGDRRSLCEAVPAARDAAAKGVVHELGSRHGATRGWGPARTVRSISARARPCSTPSLQIRQRELRG